MVMVGTARSQDSLVRKKFIDAHRQIDMALKMFDLVAEEKMVTVVNAVFPGTRLYADEALFRHLLANLIGNAIKYSSAGGKVTISMDESSPTTIAVTDTGTGIDDNLIDSIFAEDIKTSTIGTAGEKGGGLGLPWCSEIMRLHGGAINVESVPGKGSTFYAAFPATTPKVVVVTESKKDRNAILQILRTVSATGVEFVKGAEAIDYCREHEPHLVITDLGVKADDRHSLLERLKGDTRTDSIPVIAMATSNLHDEHERSIRLGADEFMILPVSKENLPPLIRKHII
jgi:CheY-like chemotaxis protein